MDLTENLESIRARIQAACARSGRNADDVALLAVTKGHPPATVSAAAELGLALFGENKVQEAKAKLPLCPARLRWHMIGHLQTNKCRDAVHLFDMIQSVDSLHLGEALNQAADKLGKTMAVLLQVNAAGESAKFGFKPDDALAALSHLNALPRLEVHGLMTMAPWTPEPEKVRPVFRRLAALKAACEAQLGAPLPHLSMGMSGDFEVAIEEGATIVRLGTSLFGPRSPVKA